MSSQPKPRLAQVGECYYCGKLSESMLDPHGDKYFCGKAHRQLYIAKSKHNAQLVKNTNEYLANVKPTQD